MSVISKSFKVLNEARVWDESGESYICHITFAISPLANIKKLKVWLSEEYERRCYCSHDCCGHWFGYALTSTLKRIKSGTYKVQVSRAVNI